jgi:hypothetical protein
MEDYLKPITPQLTFPESRYQHVISSEGSRVRGGAAIFLAPGDGQLKLVTEGARGLLYVGL